MQNSLLLLIEQSKSLVVLCTASSNRLCVLCTTNTKSCECYAQQACNRLVRALHVGSQSSGLCNAQPPNKVLSVLCTSSSNSLVVLCTSSTKSCGTSSVTRSNQSCDCSMGPPCLRQANIYFNTHVRSDPDGQPYG